MHRRISFGLVLFSAMFLSAPTSMAAPPARGEPGSDQRQVYCRSELLQCLTSGESLCDSKTKTSASYEECYSVASKLCHDLYGRKASCQTVPKVVRKLRIRLPGGGVFAP